MSDEIVMKKKPDFSKMAIQLKPRITISADGDSVFISSEGLNWNLKIERKLTLGIARKILELEAARCKDEAKRD